MDKPYLQSTDYIPQTDSGFRDWLNNFATLIAANPAQYGLTAGDSAVISAQNTAYAAAYVPTQSTATRTTAAITQKDAVKASAKGTVRVYAQIIKANQGVSNEDKMALGLHLNDPTKTPVPVPDSAPIISILGAFSGEHVITFADENSPMLRRKPAGVKQIQIYRQVATGAVLLPDGATEVGLFTRQPVKVESSPNDVAKTATYFARWVNTKGEVGPWSLPVSMTIAFGGPVEAQMPTGGTSLTGDGEGLSIAA